MQNQTPTRAWLPLAMALLVAACGTSEAPAPDLSDDTGPVPAQSTVEPESAGDAQAAMAAPDGCPQSGPLSESFDTSGTPLVFGFRIPAGYAVRSSKPIGESMYKLDLEREIARGGTLPPRYAVISVIQLRSPQDSPIPLTIANARKMKDSAIAKALADMIPKPAGIMDFGGRQFEAFRVVTDTKVVYKFNLPVDDHYREVDVHFFSAGGSAACLERMTAMADQWVRQLAPKPSG